jgi:hypothetical protein
MDTEETPFNFDAWWEIHGRKGHQDVWIAAQEAMRSRAAEVATNHECKGYHENCNCQGDIGIAIRALLIE